MMNRNEIHSLSLLKQNLQEQLSHAVAKIASNTSPDIDISLEVPPDPSMGDFAFPCFSLAKKIGRNPADLARELAAHCIRTEGIGRTEAIGPYVNFFLNAQELARNVLSRLMAEGDAYGSSPKEAGTLTIDMSSPNIAKPFGIGHLRSTIIGNALAQIASFLGYRTIKINYLGDWGTQFGKLIVGFKEFGSEDELAKDPIRHLLEIYVKVNAREDLQDQAREWFCKLEGDDAEALVFWRRFREMSISQFDAIYKRLGVTFDVISGESEYNAKLNDVIVSLEKAGLLKESEGARIVNLEEYGLGVCLIQKQDGTTLYATRDIAAAIDRYQRYHFSLMLYEVGAEQKLHFQQVFKVLSLLGHDWARDCVHIDHGFYLDTEGKKFGTRKGTTVFMEDILNETEQLAYDELLARHGELPDSTERAAKIAKAAIFYGDLKNHRAQNIVFDIKRFLSFDGDTGPYLLYTYARAQSILEKGAYLRKEECPSSENLSDNEKRLIVIIARFPETVTNAFASFAPDIIAHYAFDLAQTFNEFYHSEKVVGSATQNFRLCLVDACAQTLKNALALLGIETIEKM